MARSFRQRWFVRRQVESALEQLLQDTGIIPVVQWDDNQIAWDEECKGIGQVAWHCGYILPPDPSLRALIPLLNNKIAPLQARYDLGLTCE